MVYLACAAARRGHNCFALGCDLCGGVGFVRVSHRAYERARERRWRRLLFLRTDYREPAKPPLGQRARRAVASIPAGYVAEHLVMGGPFALLWHAGHAVGMTEDGAQRLLAGGSTARRRVWLEVLKAVQREVSDGG